MNPPAPKVSVIMSVYNAEKHLRKAIESILNQTFKDFEFIIINDGSTDTSLEIIKSYHDPRIRLIEQENQGLAKSLNTGIKTSQGEYIARMDADDVSLPERFQLQAEFLDNHLDHGLLGTTFFVLDEESNILTVKPVLLNDIDLRRELLYQTPFAHGSVMIRKNILKKIGPFIYRQEFDNSEDYDLWSRLAQVTKIANLPHILYMWRNNPQGITALKRPRQLRLKNITIESNRNNNKLTNSQTFQCSSINKYHNSQIYYKNERYTVNRRNNYSYLQLRLAKVAWKTKHHSRIFFQIMSAFNIQPFILIIIIYRRIRRWMNKK